MPSAGYELSQIVELMEIILCDVSPQDVLLWQRVCQVWKGTIDGSKHLQRKLCFVPENVQEVPRSWVESEDGELPDASTLLPLEDPHPNELLQRLLEDLANGKVYLNESSKVVPTRKGRPLASWRRMYLTQPPIKRVGLQCMFGYADGAFISAEEPIWIKSMFTEVIEDPEGVKAGDIVAMMMKRQDQMETRRTVCAEVVCAPPVEGTVEA
ncbi:hypothetical protein LTR08_005863 [Meristemomyces frigidus]|nr:hypothetical protein LTR08_005863 [Meristemomyces frigidus]